MEKKFFKTNLEMGQIKSVFSSLDHGGINLWPIVGPQFYHWYQEKKHHNGYSKKYMISRIFAFLLFKENFRIIGAGEGKILASYISEEDGRHKELFDKSLRAFDREEILILKSFIGKSFFKRYSPSVLRFLRLFKIYKKLKNKGLALVSKSRLERMYFISLVYYFTKQINVQENFLNQIKPKAYVSLCSAGGRNEQILNLLMQNRSINTFSLQHGVFFNYKGFNDALMIYDFALSDYNFVWGQKSFDILKNHIHSDGIIIAGNPKYKKLEKVESFSEIKNVGIYLGHSPNRKSNISLLKKIKNYSDKKIKFIIRLHPSESEEIYRHLLSSNMVFEEGLSLDESLSGISASITHNTTISIETLKYKIPRFRFKDKFLESSDGFDDFFSNEKELDILIKRYSKKENYKKLMKEYKKEFEDNFYQPKRTSIPEYYKKVILEKINN